jgi:N-acetylgalactosamine-N,N'-diacetylbacillosaminyl-diphospho-undecaprenol 4-alpha-N-acetylgalactosaminyltransferase
MTSDKVVLLINSLGNGGAERVVSILLDTLSYQGKPVQLVCLEQNDFYPVPVGLSVTYLSDFTGQEAGWKKLLYLPVFAWRLRKLIKGQSIGVVQSHVYRASYVNALARLLGAGHRVQMVNVGQVSLYQQEGWLGRINLALIRWLYPVAELLILKSHGMKADLAKLMPNLSVQKTVIHNPYDVEKIALQAQADPVGWRKDADKFTLVSVGRLIELKQLDDVIRALAKLPEQVELVLVGDGPQKDFLKGVAKAQGVDERVIFVGRQENPFAYLARADAFVMASRSEGFPNVLAEALLCGVPVIAADCTSGPREILAPDSDQDQQLHVGDGVEWAKNGVLVAIGDVAAFTQAVSGLMADSELRENYAQAGKIRGQDFNSTAIVAQYAKVIWHD